MKPLLCLLLGTFLLVASGCMIVPVERYVYEPTERVPPSYVWRKQQVLPRKLRPAEGEVLMVPDFDTFSTSYNGQDSFLNVFTRGNRPVFIVSAELQVPATGFRQNVELNVLTTPVPLRRDNGFWAARLRLFMDDWSPKKSIDFAKIKGADNLILIIRWRDGDRVVERRFPLRRVIRHTDAWIT